MNSLYAKGVVLDNITCMLHEDLMNNKKVRVRNSIELDKLIS